MTSDEVKSAIDGFSQGDVPDYQMSALAMAILLQGMTLDETVELTRAMLQSGRTIDWPTEASIGDKHSTGGIGDKTSLPLAPMLACCDIQVPMISGRGLGPTGGTLDKLEAIPGFRTDLSVSDIKKQVEKIGCVITGASPEVAPADRKLYALRDVTGTVESVPLITASILSKKLAAGLDALVLDVKFGSGAFMQSIEKATELAHSLVKVGELMGVKTTALLSDMNQMLGVAAGNASEVWESIAILKGEGPADASELTIELGAQLLSSFLPDTSITSHREKLLSTIRSGAAFERFEQMIDAQGGDLNALPSPEDLDIETISIKATHAGTLARINARNVGLAVIELGGGRKVVGDPINPFVGVNQLFRIGQSIQPDQPIFEIWFAKSPGEYAPTGQDQVLVAKELLESCYELGSEEIESLMLIQSIVTSQSV